MNLKNQFEIIIIFLINFPHELKSETSLGAADAKKDSKLSTTQIISKYGYSVECHKVVTEDGYILELHHIPRSKTIKNSNKKFPVLLQHGFQGTSAGFVVLGPKKALAFVLANAGYDVWMGNFRGNTYSRAHTTLDSSSSAFWNFTWHEHGVYDLPATIDYICNYTGIEKLIYIGYSMGTTSFFVMVSEKPEYQSKIEEAVLMAVSVFLGHIKLPLKLIAILVDYFPPLDVFMNRPLGINGLLRHLFVKVFCSRPKFMNICVAFTQLVVGFNPRGWPGDLSENIFSHIPGGTSLKTLIHFAQIIHTGHFRQFDYKFWGNRVHYGSPKPPAYDISKTYTKLHIIEGHNDNLSVREDVDIITQKLRSIKNIEYVNNTCFNHVDFLYSKYAKRFLYDRIIDIVNAAGNGE